MAMDCFHPFAFLRSVGIPGQTWCEVCKKLVACSHPFYRLNYEEVRHPWCEACGSTLPPDPQVMTKVMHGVIAVPQHSKVH